MARTLGVGYNAGTKDQGLESIAIGPFAGQTEQEMALVELVGQ